MQTLNWRLAFAALIACVAALGLAGCVEQDEPDGTSTSDVDIDNDATDDDDVTDDTNDQETPDGDMNDEGPMDDATGNPMDDDSEDATEAPTP